MMKKILLFIIGILVGCFLTISYFNFSKPNESKEISEQTNYPTKSKESVSELNQITYERSSTTVDITVVSTEEYIINISLNFNDQIDFSGYSNNETAFASISFDGVVPYSILDASMKYIQIPLENGRLPSVYHFSVSSEDHAFKDENLNILNQYLRQETDELVVSVNVFDPNGFIIFVSNVFVN